MKIKGDKLKPEEVNALFWMSDNKVIPPEIKEIDKEIKAKREELIKTEQYDTKKINEIVQLQLLKDKIYIEYATKLAKEIN